MKSMLYKVVEAILLLTIPLWSVSALSQDAESYYVENVETIIQSKCIGCHRSGGQAGGTSLRFTSSASSNHDVFDSYVNTPTPGSRANTVLTKIRGGAGHGGGVQVTEGSSEYQRFTQYMDLLSEVPEPTPSLPSAPLNVSAAAGNASATVSFSVPSDDGGATIISYTATSSPGSLSGTCTASPCLVEGLSNGTAYTFTVSATNEAGQGPDSDSSNAVTPNAPQEVLRLTLEEPLNSETHMGIGNLRGWAVASSGITKVEVLVDGVYVYDAPYGGQRGDVGGAFSEIEDSDKSGFSLAYNYSALSAGEHTVTVVAHSELGDTEQKSATFNVVKFAKNFISDPDAVNLNGATCSVAGDAVKLYDAFFDDVLYDVTLKWRKPGQGFEIIDIR